jgi:hypothetical protein
VEFEAAAQLGPGQWTLIAQQAQHPLLDRHGASPPEHIRALL